MNYSGKKEKNFSASLMEGQSAGLVNQIKPLREVLSDLIREAGAELNTIEEKIRALKFSPPVM